MHFFRSLEDKCLWRPIATLIEPYKGQTLLLGLSGGPDSSALFHFLLRAGVSFAVAHVDHQWREESGEEALVLRRLVEQAGVVFHQHTLEKKAPDEAGAREDRLTFFKQLCVSYGYPGVLLGHHSDDQAETVLKRIFEGSVYGALQGMRPVTFWQELLILRPWLSIEKKRIIQFLERERLSFFVDKTNEENVYLRGRMRTQLIPYIETIFGKKIGRALSRLGQQAAAWESYMEERITSLQVVCEESSPLERHWWLSQPLHPLELRWELRRLCQRWAISLSYEELERAAQFITALASKKRVGPLHINRGRVSLYS